MSTRSTIRYKRWRASEVVALEVGAQAFKEFRGNAATEFGLKHENSVNVEYEKYLKNQFIKKECAKVLSGALKTPLDDMKRSVVLDNAKTFPSGLVCRPGRQYIRASPDKWVHDPANERGLQDGMVEFKCFWRFRNWTFMQMHHFFHTELGKNHPYKKLFPLVMKDSVLVLDKNHKFYQQCQSKFPFSPTSLSFYLRTRRIYTLLLFTSIHYAFVFRSIIFSLFFFWGGWEGRLFQHN